jgi:hypothetical protein
VLGAFSYAAVILSHNITAFLFSLLLGAYILYWGVVSGRWKWCGQALAAMALAVGMTAFFWFPSLYDTRWVQIHALQKGTFDFHDHFLDLRNLFALSVPIDSGSHNPYMPFNLGMAQVFLAAMGLAAAGWRLIRRDVAGVAMGAHVIFFLALLLLCILLMLPVSTPIWERVPLLAFVEFPWRLLGLAALATAGMAGASITIWRGRWANLALAVSLLIILGDALVFTYPRHPFRSYQDISVQDIVREEKSSGVIGTAAGNEYLPLWVTQFPFTSPLVTAYLNGEEAEKFDYGRLTAGARASLLTASPSSVSYQLENTEPFQARFFTFYFPGWRAEVDGKAAELAPEEGSGLITLLVLPGKHQVRLFWAEIPHRLAADGLSALSLLLLVVIAGASWIAGRRQTPRMPLPTGDDLSGRTAVLLGGFLLVLLVVKQGRIDPHTDWFRQESPPGQVIGCPHPLQVNLGGLVQLLCYEVEPTSLRPGDALRVTTFWEAQQKLTENYSSFVRLVAPDGQVWAQSDHTNPGDLPSTNWFKTWYVRDEHLVRLPPQAPPIEYTVQAGLYNPRDGQQLTITLPTGSTVDAVDLQPVRVRPLHPPNLRGLLPGTVYRFGDSLTLLGYRWQERQVPAGASLRLVLYWRAERQMDENYTVFAQVLDAQNRIWGQKDGWPVDGLYPTSRWQKGEIVEDERLIPIQSATPSGQYRLVIGLYQLETLQRLEIVGPAGVVPDRALPLEPPVEIRP